MLNGGVNWITPLGAEEFVVRTSQFKRFVEVSKTHGWFAALVGDGSLPIDSKKSRRFVVDRNADDDRYRSPDVNPPLWPPRLSAP